LPRFLEQEHNLKTDDMLGVFTWADRSGWALSPASLAGC